MIMVRDCAMVVSDLLSIPIKDIYGIRKNRIVMEARFYTYWLAKNYTMFSYPRIGKALNRDHTTILHGVRKINGLLDSRDDRAVHYCKQLKEELDRRFGNIEEKIIETCEENELRDMIPILTKRLYQITRRLSKENQHETSPANV